MSELEKVADDRLQKVSDEDFRKKHTAVLKVPVAASAAPPPDAQPQPAPAPQADAMPDLSKVAEEILAGSADDTARAEPAPATRDDLMAIIEALDQKRAEAETQRDKRYEANLKALKRAEKEYGEAEDVETASKYEQEVAGLQETIQKTQQSHDALKTRLDAQEGRERNRFLDEQDGRLRHLADKLSDVLPKDQNGRPWVLPETILAGFDDELRATPNLQNLDLLAAAKRVMPKVAERAYAKTAELRDKAAARKAAQPDAAASVPAQSVVESPPVSGTQGARMTEDEIDVSTKEAREKKGGFWDRFWGTVEQGTRTK